MEMEKGTITRVTLYKDKKTYDILIGSFGFLFSAKYGVVPKVGDDIIVYTKGLSTIRGIDLNGKRIFYKTDEDIDREHEEWKAEYQRKKEEEFKKNESTLNASYDKLPDVFKERIDNFRKNNPLFRVDYEAYEMFCCEQAVVIADKLKTGEKIKEFQDQEYEKQKKMVPKLASGHSGNTFGMAVYLAYWYVTEKDNITKVPGALSPLVGSKEYEEKNKRVSIADKI